MSGAQSTALAMGAVRPRLRDTARAYRYGDRLWSANPTTVTVSTLVLAILGTAAANTHKRVPATLAGALSGGIIGLCAGIVLL
jgi:hypothetical protein